MNHPTAVRCKIRWRTSLTTTAVLATIVAGAGAGQASAQAQRDIHAVAPQLVSVAGKSPATRVGVIVEFRAGVGRKQAAALVARAHGTVTDALPVIDGLAARISARGGVSLGSDRDVRAVTLNGPVTVQGAPSVNVSELASAWDQDVNAPTVWNDKPSYTGQGIGVAVIDSGVDGNLPDFQVSQTDTASRVVASAVVNPGATSADDPYGHGTMVAGIIAGNGLNLPSSNPLFGQYIGVAPNADIISIKVGDDEGDATLLDVINGIQFAIANQGAYNIRVINLSLESDTAQSYTTDPLDAAVQAAINAGIVVVVSAGNLGNAPGAVDYAPGNDPNAIVVGATSVPQIASWSSQGVTQDGIAEPDIYAPGAHIVSALAPNSAFASMCPTCILGANQYIRASGTSFAAPIVSGAVADMLQANPSLTPAQVKADLVSSAAAIPAAPTVSTPGVIVAPTPTLMPAGTDTPSPGPTPAPGRQPAGELQVDQAIAAATAKGPQPTASGVANAPAASTSWGPATFATAPASLTASWARSSWSCQSCTGAGAAVDPSRSSWSRSSWSVEGTG